MARRGDVAALDNIDLDDMFADEGDALFDGLDIDLDTMDDIAGGTKRPTSDDDDDDDSYRPKKRKKLKKKANADELGMSMNSHSTTASSSQRSSKIPNHQQQHPSVHRHHQHTTQKAKTTSTSTSSPPQQQQKAKRSKSRSKLEQEKDEYFRHIHTIGIQKSSEHFYPFSDETTIPPDLTLKSTRVFNSIHRMHASFQSHLSVTPDHVVPVPEDTAIAKLLQEALNSCKKPAHESTALTMGNAIAAMRTIIQDNLDRYQMASDWYHAMAILQRQFLFLQQNAENMERFLRNHLDDSEWKEIYIGCSKLAELKVPVFHVKLVGPQVLHNWKDRPRQPLVASLGAAIPSNAAAPAASETVTTAPTTTLAEPILPATRKQQQQQHHQYAQLAPAERRQRIQDTLRQIVPKLSTDKSALPMSDSPKLANEIPNTKTMWKWSERYFGSLTRRQLLHYIGELKEVIVTKNPEDEKPPVSTHHHQLMDRLASLLVPIHEDECKNDDTSVEEEDMAVDDDDENDCNDESSSKPQQLSDKQQGKSNGDMMDVDASDSDDNESYSESYRDNTRLDVSTLSEDQVVYLQLQRHNLAEFLDPPGQKPPAKPNGAEPQPPHLTNGLHHQHHTDRQTTEIDDEISELIGELHRTDEINNKRLELLEKLVQPFDERTLKYEMMLTAKCQQMLRKAKESRAKAERLEAKKKDDTINTLFNLPPNR